MQISVTEILTIAVSTVNAALSTPAGVLALVSAGIASALTVISTFLKTMIPLRWLAVGSNVGFSSTGCCTRHCR